MKEDKKLLVDHETMMRIVGMNFKAARDKTCLSQEEFADKLGVSRNYVSLVELGKKYPKLEVLLDATEIAGVSLEFMFEGNPVREALSRVTEVYGVEAVQSALQKMK